MQKILYILLLLVAPALQATTENITFKNPHVRYLNGARNLAAYVTIENSGKEAVHITAARSTICKKTELHEHVIKNGIAKMQSIAKLTIPAKGKAILKRGGNHIMLMGIIRSECQKALSNDKIMITITFSDGSKKEIEFKIVWPA